MLVLTRKLHEVIIINDEIKITIVKTGSSVKLGFTAPAGVKIMRAELLEKK